MYLIDKILRDDNRHETLVMCGGHKYRITTADCDLLCLEEGLTLSDEELTQLQEAESRLSCIQKAFSLLSYGDMSKKRMTEKLCRHFEKQLSTEVADLLEERGYLDDIRLAQRYAESYYEIRSYGPMRIKQELYGKGFSLDVIEQAIEPYCRMDHREKILDLLHSKFSRFDLCDIAVKKKAVAWLNRSGYTWSDISDVLNQFCE